MSAAEEEQPGLLLVPTDVDPAELAELVEAIRTSDPSNVRVLHLRESGSEFPARQLGDDVLEQAGRWQIGLLIILVALIIAVIVGTALLAG